MLMILHMPKLLISSYVMQNMKVNAVGAVSVRRESSRTLHCAYDAGKKAVLGNPSISLIIKHKVHFCKDMRF